MSEAPKLVPTSGFSSLRSHTPVGMENFPPSSNGKRFLAAMIDGFVSGVVWQLGFYLLNAAMTSTTWALLVSVIAVTVLYYVLPTVKYGYTIGKKLMEIKVVSKNFDEKLGFMQILIREIFGKWFLLFGYFWILFRKDRRAWHDMVSGTRVIEFK